MTDSYPRRSKPATRKVEVQLPDFGINQWSLSRVEAEPSLHLYREDLCVTDAFYHEYAVTSLDEALVNFTSIDPFWTPLHYTFSFVLTSLFYESYVSSPLLRRTKFKVESKQLVSVGAPWELEKEETIFEFFIDSNYRRRLRVGGHSEKEAQSHWNTTAIFLRRRIRELKKAGAIDTKE